MWMFTGACPSHCTYCDIDSQKGKKTLSSEEVERVSREIIAAGFSEVMFAGGEPLLSPDLPRALAVFRDRLPTAVFTGGLPAMVDRNVTVLREGGVKRLVYSIDAGDPKVNDVLRGRPGVTDDLCSFAAAVRDRIPRIDRSVNTVVSRFNVEQLEGIWDRMSPFGLNSWSLTVAGDFFQGSPRHAFLSESALETFYLRTVPALAARLARQRAELVVLPVPLPFLVGRVPPSRWGEAAPAMRAELEAEFSLYAQGEYNASFVRRFGCPLVGIDVVIGVSGENPSVSQPPIIHPDYVIGNVKEQSLEAILGGERLRQFAEGVPNAPCTRCWAPSNIPRETLLRMVQ